ncbi:MAG: CinA family nicotinamide mononucleotide deamidase-related protein [Bryobacteraceae bacterium]|nr:CinA family nicotinamide mononucleotide deamidase-related protein [Bryobacteraceae bacterium]
MRNAAIIAVGSEMLTPTRLDTNSLFLTERLNSLGVEVVEKRVIGDDRTRLMEAVRHALAGADIAIVTGGLGPTEDDVTRDAVAAALEIGQSSNEAVAQWIADRFARMGRTMAANNLRQAMVLDGAEILDNPNGTAPGQWIAKDGRVTMLLPGPPRELKPLFDAECMPRLRAMLPPMAIAEAHFKVAGMGESDLDQLIAPVYTKYENPATTVLAKPGDLEVILRARAATAEEARALCEPPAAAIAELLGERVYSRNGETLEAALGRALLARSETVAVAESMTGGLLGSRMTDVPGSSRWFRGGYVVYNDDLKRALIGEFSGDAVSEEVARRLAESARERAGATWAIGITGYAGPEGQVGLVYLALAGPEGAVAREVKLIGDRQRIRQMATTASLDWLRRKLL